LAGLDPEDISILLNQQNTVDQIRSGTVRDLMSRITTSDINRQKRIDAVAAARSEAEANKIKRQQKLEDDQADRQFELGKLMLQDQLRRARTPEEKAKAEADLAAVNALTEQRQAQKAKVEKETKLLDTTKGMTPYQQAQLEISRGNLQARLNTAKSEEERKRIEAQQNMMDFILDPDTNSDAARIEAIRANNNPNSDVVYYYDTDWTNEWAVVPIPQGLMFNGKPATADEISRRAELAGMEVDKYLEEVQKRMQR